MTNYKNRIVGTGTANPKELKANSLNWRKHPDSQRKALSDVLDKVGWIQDVIVNKTTGNLVDGHLRVETAIKNKETEIPVKYVELTEDEEKVALATFDPISAMAEQDDEILKKLLAEMDAEIDMSQYYDDYDKLMKVEHTEEELDAVPEVPKEAKTKRGDVYRLGDHVLMCGDSTSEEDVGKLMNGVVAELALTDPPYGVNAVHVERERERERESCLRQGWWWWTTRIRQEEERSVKWAAKELLIRVITCLLSVTNQQIQQRSLMRC